MKNQSKQVFHFSCILFTIFICTFDLNAQNQMETEPNNNINDSGVQFIISNITVMGELEDDGIDLWKIPFGTNGSLTLSNYPNSTFGIDFSVFLISNPNGYQQQGSEFQFLSDGQSVSLNGSNYYYLRIYSRFAEKTA